MPQRIAYNQIAPEAVKVLSAARPYLAACGISARLRALIELRVSQINGCAFCMDMHSNEARHAGESQQRLDCLAAWRETSFFDERERAALAWAESVTLISQTSVPDSVFDVLKQHYSEKEIVDLTLIITVMNSWNRIAISFRQEPVARRETTHSESR